MLVLAPVVVSGKDVVHQTANHNGPGLFEAGTFEFFDNHRRSLRASMARRISGGRFRKGGEMPSPLYYPEMMLTQAPSRCNFRMLWSFAPAMMGLPPKNSRRMHSEAEIPPVSVCYSFIFFGTVRLSVRRL